MANERYFLDDMYEVQYEGYFPIYEDGPEYCTVVVHYDNFGRSYLVTIYDSQGKPVAMWKKDEEGNVLSGWMIVKGKYYIFNPETNQWERASVDFVPRGKPLPS